MTGGDRNFVCLLLSGVIAAIPAAALADRYYWITDETDPEAEGGAGDIHRFDNGAGYAAFTDPCPATVVGTDPFLTWLRVASTP